MAGSVGREAEDIEASVDGSVEPEWCEAAGVAGIGDGRCVVPPL